MAKKEKDKELTRRQFLRFGIATAIGVGAVGAGITYLSTKDTTNGENMLRPPGAIANDDFMYACIKCGLCVQICPIDAIKLADVTQGLSYGTPYLNVREQACDFSCGAMQCVETCPTAALDFIQFKRVGEAANAKYEQEHPNDLDYNIIAVQLPAMHAQTHMGTAVLNTDTCLAAQGKGFKGAPRDANFKGVYASPEDAKKGLAPYPVNEHQFDRPICDICVTECPIGETAIIVENKIPKVLDGCTGCGVCAMICPTEGPSITIKKA
ncbi:MAG TPA: 4Fe-4S dicluster domain-containing protein [Saprospiraceae bacterium]|nr:4Fe-4S dicluster domain-containing protein [Saprospiraceae bacterium]